MLLKFTSVLAIASVALTSMAESDQGVLSPLAGELCGNIGFKSADSSSTLKGYVSNGRVSEFAPFQRTRRLVNALQVCFSSAMPVAIPDDLKIMNTLVTAKSKGRYFGVVSGPGSKSQDITQGSSDYQRLMHTEKSVKPTQSPDGRFSYESTIWVYKGGKELTVQYTNSDDEVVEAFTGLWHDPKSNSDVFILTGDKNKFIDDYGPAVWVNFEFEKTS